MTEKTIDRRAAEWALSGDTGVSSESIAKHMMGLPGGTWGYGYPSDGSDLGRCIRLLDAIPEWRERLPEMARHSEAWAELVKHWDELETMHRDDDKRLYGRMKAMLAGPEGRDRNLVKLGNGVSLRFGGSV